MYFNSLSELQGSLFGATCRIGKSRQSFAMYYVHKRHPQNSCYLLPYYKMHLDSSLCFVVLSTGSDAWI